MRIFGTVLLLATLLALLAGSLWFAFGLWGPDDAVTLPTTMYVAMAIGIVFSLAVGIGLMGLVFYSSRQGYDDRASGAPNADEVERS